MSSSPDPSSDPARPPDPDPAQVRMREIFRAAAEKSTGPGKPYFERLSETFNAYQDTADTGDVVKFLHTEQEFRAAMDDTKLFAKIDPDTVKILLEASNAIVKAAAEGKDKPAVVEPPVAPAKKKPVKVWRF